ncbi:MAG TPA: hypothetical protein DCZ63_08555 [Geobacter sp.]|nr:hypothetical protein [Geobacter sp.]
MNKNDRLKYMRVSEIEHEYQLVIQFDAYGVSQMFRPVADVREVIICLKLITERLERRTQCVQK